PVPEIPCRAGGGGERAALWLGPDEWLLIAPARLASALPAMLNRALDELPHSLVDVSHRQTALAVSGPEAATLLAAGCPLDLDTSAFPVGMCTRTMLAKAEIVLWRTERLEFRIERTELTAGSTWHAAGLLPLFNMSYTVGQLHKYSVDLYKRLPAETGQDVSFHVTGNLRLATCRERMDEYQKYCGTANTIGVPF